MTIVSKFESDDMRDRIVDLKEVMNACGSYHPGLKVIAMDNGKDIDGDNHYAKRMFEHISEKANGDSIMGEWLNNGVKYFGSFPEIRKYLMKNFLGYEEI